MRDLFDPPYVEALGLTDTPFRDGDGAAYYEEPSREQQLKALSHFVQYTNLVLFVEGPARAGKTTLLHRFIAQAPEGMRLCHMAGSEDLSRAPLLAAMADAFGMPDRGLAGAALEEALREHLDGLGQSELGALLVVDDAHRLPEETVELIASLAAKTERDEALLHAVLFGEYLSEAHSAAARRQVPDREAFKTIELPPFGEEQTREYLYRQLREAGAARPEALFSTADVQRIHREAKGLPGIINTLAVEHLQARAAKTNTASNAKNAGGSRRAGSVVLVLLAVGIAAVWLGSGTDPEDARVDGPRGEQLVQPLTLPGQQEEQTAPVSGAIKREAAIATEPAPKVETVAAIAGENMLPEEKPEAPETQAPEKPAETKPVNTEPPKPAAPKTRNGLRGADWLKRQDPNHFTLQLVASGREQAIVDFARRHGVMDEAAYFRGLRNGKDWYSLVYGAYPDRATADTAAKALPAGIKSRPWIRTFGSIQTDIRQAP